MVWWQPLVPTRMRLSRHWIRFPIVMISLNWQLSVAFPIFPLDCRSVLMSILLFWLWPSAVVWLWLSLIRHRIFSCMQLLLLIFWWTVRDRISVTLIAWMRLRKHKLEKMQQRQRLSWHQERRYLMPWWRAVREVLLTLWRKVWMQELCRTISFRSIWSPLSRRWVSFLRKRNITCLSWLPVRRQWRRPLRIWSQCWSKMMRKKRQQSSWQRWRAIFMTSAKILWCWCWRIMVTEWLISAKMYRRNALLRRLLKNMRPSSAFLLWWQRRWWECVTW